MAQIFQLNSKGTVVLHNDAYKLCPELKNLTEEELLFMILAYDYKSPYHKFPEEERIRKAKRQVWNTKDFEFKNKDYIDKAIEFYKSIQYDIDQEILRNYQEKIDKLNAKLQDTELNAEIKSIISVIDIMEKKINDIQERIDKDNEININLKGNIKLSLLERMQRSRELYEKKRNYMKDKTISVDYSKTYFEDDDQNFS